MSYAAIKVESLAKRYKIATRRALYKTLGDTLTSNFKNRFSGRAAAKKDEEFFWALRDISFEIKQGETVGIIGHNGAGKSTLLKILSRITEPTSGCADIYGRVGSLLEVGTGFHLELSGRENIYLSGAIMGMKKADIARKFDEIVSFAAVEKFVDTPVKHYSTGMHLRLAFAVAAHLEPEILLVDEVLAVGDLEFQKKCLSKMESVAGEGRTVLFVSHNMGSIKELCQTGLVLKNGKADFCGSVVEAISHYSRNILNLGFNESENTLQAGFRRVTVNGGSVENQLINTEPFTIEADLMLDDRLRQTVAHCIIENSEGAQVAHNYVRLSELGFETLASGRHSIKAQMPALYLKPGVYTLYLKLLGESATQMQQVKYFSERLILDVVDKTNLFAGKVYATVLPPVEWNFAAAELVRSAAKNNEHQHLCAPERETIKSLF